MDSELLFIISPKRTHLDERKRLAGSATYTANIKRKIIVFGISYDSPKALKAFKEKYVLPFNFLSDKTKEVSKAYGAAGTGWPKRKTFIIDPKGKIEKIYRKGECKYSCGKNFR